ncbi:beta-ketoacyl reductase [Nonomuraea antimicrobica]
MSRGAAATVTLVQALADAEVGAPLWVVTSGGVALGEAGEPASPFQASVWGMGAVLAVDHPNTWGGIIDLPSAPRAEEVALLRDVLAGGEDREDQVAIRAGGVHARRMVPSPKGPAEVWRPRGTVLVTGGTGGVGANVARWLAREGADRVVLVSRAGRSAPGAADLEAELTGLGAAVTIAGCDVTDRDAVRDLLESLSDEPPLTAVMHAAGAGHDDMPVTGTTPADFAGVGRAKIAGAVNLDELLGDRPLEAFVLFSSGAAVWGSSGQAPYAAANGFLDGLARRRRARGLVGVSIAWGGWGGGGMMEGTGGERLGRSGLRAMAPEIAAAAIGQAVAAGDAHLVVTDIDWERFAPAFALARPRPLVSAIPEFARALAGSDTVEDEDGGTALATRLAGLSPDERARALVSLVRSEAAAVLGHPSVDPIEPDRAFNELGFDSLTSVELRNQLLQATRVKLPVTLVFDHPTPVALARFLGEQLAPEESPAASLLARLDEMEQLLREQALPSGERARIADRFRDVLRAAERPNGEAEEADAEQDFDDLSDDELFAALDDQLGTS